MAPSMRCVLAFTLLTLAGTSQGLDLLSDLRGYLGYNDVHSNQNVIDPDSIAYNPDTDPVYPDTESESDEEPVIVNLDSDSPADEVEEEDEEELAADSESESPSDEPRTLKLHKGKRRKNSKNKDGSSTGNQTSKAKSWPESVVKPDNPWLKQKSWAPNDPRQMANRKNSGEGGDNEEANEDGEKEEDDELPQSDSWARYNRPQTYNGYPALAPRNNYAYLSAPNMAEVNSGYFNVAPLEKYISDCPDCFNLVNDNICPFQGPALELKKWAGELEDVLSHGCKAEGCSDGACCLNKVDPFEPTIVRMTQMLKDVYYTIQKNCRNCGPVDCTWNPWGPWSQCDRTCDEGKQTRTRTSTAPERGGKQCVGSDTDVKQCYNGDCCKNGQWTPWGPWSRCSETCGRSIVSRTRTCSNPPPNHCGLSCPGDSQETREKTCGPDVSHGSWSSWGYWSPCTAGCGQEAIQTRERTCDGQNSCGRDCLGRAFEEKTCAGPMCIQTIPREWEMWSPWSECTSSCGKQEVTRYRVCSVHGNEEGIVRTNCVGERTETRTKRCGPVPQNGFWAEWGSWSVCSATCGSGFYSRSRTCSNPPANRCGRKCPGLSFVREQCDMPPCQVCIDGDWGSWGSWSGCSATCGEAIVTRTRYCDRPAPNNCGNECRGPRTESKPQQCGPPALDARWQSWAPWSACSSSCGPGTNSRTRVCRPGNACGRDCRAPSFELGTCMSPPCRKCVHGNWGSWEPWSRCTQTCGTAPVFRRRQCNNPPKNFCGDDCPGSDIENKEQMCGPARVDGRWDNWGPWSACTVSCGEGVLSRTRVCVSSPCGAPCFGQDRGEDRDTKVERCGPPAVDSVWAQWAPWSSCSVSCGSAVVYRNRVCNRNACGGNCRGSDTDSKQQICGPSEVDSLWSLWGPWSTCATSCGSSTVYRNRICNRNACGGNCRGLIRERDSKEVTCGPDAVDSFWAPWAPWSECTTTCGNGQVTRNRVCNRNACSGNCRGRDVDVKQKPCGPASVESKWAPWGSWSACASTCGKGIVTRKRVCDVHPCGGGRCRGKARDTRVQQCGPPEVDSQWGPWGQYSHCTVSCGTGRVTRTRQCNFNACGGPCLGRDSDTTDKQCGPAQVASTWGSWSDYGPCSATCGLGEKTRQRRCSTNPCGGYCTGRDVDVTQCNGPPCCTDGQWSLWTRWDQCPPGRCGNVLVSRTRLCNSPPPNHCGKTCPGEDLQQELKQCGEEVDGNWGAWDSWSACTVSCGDGLVSRTRRCDNPRNNACGSPCVGEDRDTKFISCGPVADDGRWSSWGEWSRCSSSCGQGQRNRKRTCSNPFPNGCSRGCAGPDFEVGECNNPPCCVDGRWSSWGEWSSCPQTCGEAEVMRTRACNNPAPDSCGKDCLGSDRDTKRQVCGPAAVDGNWASWGRWGPCSTTCGVGSYTRSRSCSNPPASSCGRQCRGRDFEVGRCNEDVPCEPCEQRSWTQWNSWGPCSATCGNGVQKRVRGCEVVVAGRNCGTRFCPGRDIEQQACVGRLPDCTKYDWNQWANWCPCDCRTGKQSRRRECSLIDGRGGRSQADLASCQGAAREEKYCDVRQARCPQCITSCKGQPDGNYYSCSSCKQYMSCRNGQAVCHQCKRGLAMWDSFVQKCVSPPSPSCALLEPVKDCKGQIDGRYHSRQGCNWYAECRNGRFSQRQCPRGQEFNAHLGECDSGRSPTCMRDSECTLETRRNDAVIGGTFIDIRDAPADMYYDEQNGLNPAERRKAYEKQRLEDELANTGDIERAAVLRGKIRTLEEDEVKEANIEANTEAREAKENRLILGGALERMTRRRRFNPDCITSCEGQEAGQYASCRGCDTHVICTKRGRMHERRCHKAREWDNNLRKCVKTSATCIKM